MIYMNSPVIKGFILAGVGCAVLGNGVVMLHQGMYKDKDWSTQLAQYGSLIGGAGLIAGGLAKMAGVF